MDAGMPQRLDEEGLPAKEAHPNVFEIYNREAKVYDSAMVERWRTAMEGLLIFAGLFSAVVTAFIIESYKTLQPDPNDQMVALLAQISHQLAGGQTPNPPTLPNDPSSPPWTAVATNILWFISLGLSLACAVAATLVQQWARNYVHAIERRPSAERRARMRMYLFEGVERFGMSRIVDGVPALIHAALFTFLLGLVLFIKTVSVPVTIISILILVISTAAYLFASLVPFVVYDCPYQTPLTAIFWQKGFIRLFYWICGHTLLLTKDMSSLISTPANAIVAIVQSAYSTVSGLADAMWTFIDLIMRSFLTGWVQRLVGRFRDENPLEALHPVLMHSTGWTRNHRDVLTSWSSEHVDATFDATRARAARNDYSVAFWEREEKAFKWLAGCLDGDRELLPFIEALPSYISEVDDGRHRAWSRRPFSASKVLSAILLDTSLHLRERATNMRRRHPDSGRVWSAYLEFCLTIPNRTLIPMFESDPGHDLLFHLLYEFPVPPDDSPAVTKIKGYGLRAIFTTCWTMSPPDRIPEPSYAILDQLEQIHSKILADDIRFPTASRRLISRCFTNRSITLVNRLDDPVLWQAQICCFEVVRFYLDIAPELVKLTQQEARSLEKLFVALHSQFRLAQESEHLFCAVMLFVLTTLQSCSESIQSELDYSLDTPLGYLSRVRERSALEIVHEILDLPFWFTRFPWRYVDIFTNLEQFRDDLGLFHISKSVREKRQLLLFSIQGFLEATETVASLDLRGADTSLQRDFIEVTTHLPFTTDWETADLTTGIDSIVLFTEAMMDVFYTLTDLECLRDALRFMDRFLSLRNYPYHQLGIECREYLRATIFEKGRQEAGVQVDDEMSRWTEVAIQTG